MSMFELSLELGKGMWLTREQIEKLSKALEECPGSDLIFIKNVPNGSGIGSDTWGYIYKHGNWFLKPTLSAEVNLTDVSLW